MAISKLGARSKWVELATASPSGVGGFDFTSISTQYYYLMVIWNQITSSSSGNVTIDFRINSDTGSNYSYNYIQSSTTAVAGDSNADKILIGNFNNAKGSGKLLIEGANDIYKTISYWSGLDSGSHYNNGVGQWNGTADITTLNFIFTGGTPNGGTFKLLGKN